MPRKCMATRRCRPSGGTWVNHTMLHPYDSHLDLAHNFMRNAGIDPLAEILGLEKLLLEQGTPPQVFYG